MNIKNDKGITLVVLIITVILMLILAGVGIYNASQSYKNGVLNSFIAEMQLIQSKINTISYNEGILLGSEIPGGRTAQLTSIISSENLTGTTSSDWRFFSKETLNSDLDIEGIDDEIAVNFLTKEVVSFIGIDYKGTTYYTQYNLPGGQHIIARDIDDVLVFNTDISIDGLNANVKINYTTVVDSFSLKYKRLSDENRTNLYGTFESDTSDSWHTIQNDEFNVSRTGKYVILSKNNDNDQEFYSYAVIVLTNAPKLQEGMTKLNIEEEPLQDGEKWEYQYFDGSNSYIFAGARAELNGENYIWIPRFAYNLSDPNLIYIRFLKGNSNIPTDEGSIIIDENNWKIPDVYTNSNTRTRI